MKSREDRVRELAEEFRPALIDFARRIIRTPSLTGEEKEVSELIKAELEKLGYDQVFRDKWGNIVGIVKGTEEGPTIMYNGHMDHVDIGDPSEWEGYEPYGGQMDECEILNEERTGTEITQCIHGRAASDVKSGIACQVYSGGILKILRDEGYPVKGNYLAGFVVMEEPAEQIGMIGLFDDTLPSMGIPVAGVVSCEATGLKLYLGHRGRVEINVEVQGITSHGSAPWLGVNAVLKAQKLITAVEERYARDDVPSDEKLGKASIALTVISCKPGAMCVVPDRCNLVYDRRLVPSETPEGCVAEIQEIIDRLSAEDKDFRAVVSISQVPRTTYTGIEVALPNIKEGWRIDEDHPFVKAAAAGLRRIGEPVSYSWWDFGTDLAMVSGRHHVASLGYSPMQELYCHRPVDKCRTDFMIRALAGNIAIFDELVKLSPEDFKM